MSTYTDIITGVQAARRDGRAADGSSLENYSIPPDTEGSNPSLSSTTILSPVSQIKLIISIHH